MAASNLAEYLIEDERDPVPFSREHRALVYRRAKDVHDAQPFGTVKDVNAVGYGWISHSIRPKALSDHNFHVAIGGPDCRQPYSASVFNISGASFGALGANAIMALNWGAKLGGFAHNTGEGSISNHHRKYGGDIVRQVATGYFGCRTPDGEFDPDRFCRQARDPQVRMIEVKLSQGTKPGHGGVLPKAKITAEIAETRGIGREQDCVSLAVGCIQSRSCHTNGCPTGVATQDPLRQRALVVADKAPRVANFHRNTLRALAELLGRRRIGSSRGLEALASADPPSERRGHAG